MSIVKVGLLRCTLSAEKTERLSRRLTPKRVVSHGIVGLTGDQIASQCKEHNVKLLVLGSPDPVPAITAAAGIPVLVHRNGDWMRANFSPQNVSFAPFIFPPNGVPFALRAPNAACPRASVLSGDLTPAQVLAVVGSVENSILLLPEAVPSICDAQRAGIRCIAFAPDDEVVEVIVYVHDNPFSIQFEMKPFVA